MRDPPERSELPGCSNDAPGPHFPLPLRAPVDLWAAFLGLFRQPALRLFKYLAGKSVGVLQADLTDEQDLKRVESQLREDERVGVLVNNAGALVPGNFLDQSGSDIAGLIALNVTALTRLANAVAPRLAAAGEGAIINIASIVGLAPEIGLTVYGATKAFVLFLTQGLNLELGPKGIYVQAVVPVRHPHRNLGTLRP